MFCKFCGSSIPDNAAFCSHCGAAQHTPPQGSVQQGQYGYQNNANPTNGYQNNAYQNGYPNNLPKPDLDIGGFGWAFLGFIQPLIGFILFLVWRHMMPNRSKSCGKGALVGVICIVLFYIFYFIFVFVVALLAPSTGYNFVGGF